MVCDGGKELTGRSMVFNVGKIILVMIIFSGCNIVAGIEFKQTHGKAINGDVRSQLRLAQFYDKGMFIEKHEEAAEYWYWVAANNGNETATSILCNSFDICKNTTTKES